MTDRLHYYLESNDPALYPINQKNHVLCKINLGTTVFVQKLDNDGLPFAAAYGEYRAWKLRKFALNQTILEPVFALTHKQRNSGALLNVAGAAF